MNPLPKLLIPPKRLLSLRIDFHIVRLAFQEISPTNPILKLYEWRSYDNCGHKINESHCSN